MPDLDQELVERVARWCADAGRTTVPAEIRSALGGLSWDELLAARALLADPPPARPLGPFALADLARGVPAETAAERERDGRYPSVADDGAAPAPAGAPAAAEPAPRARNAAPRAPRSAGVVIRRARDAAPPAPPASPSVPLVDELFLPEGRAVLERLVRRLGARRHALVAALAQGWRRADGGAVDDDVLTRLLDLHGLARGFARRERDELLHALRAAGGLRSAAAARLGLDRDALDAALARAGAAEDAERIREARRGEVRAKATLAERVRLLLGDPARLEDLGVLAEVEEDLRRRLPEHVRAVGAAGGPILLALARSLSASPVEVKALLERLGLAIDGGPATQVAAPGRAPARARPRIPSPSAGAVGGLRPPRRTGVERGGREGASRGPARGPARTDRRAPPGASGTFGPDRGDRRGGGREGARGPRTGGTGAPGARRDRREQAPRGGAPGDRRERGAWGPRGGAPGDRREQASRGGAPGDRRERGAWGPRGGAPGDRREQASRGGAPGNQRERGAWGPRSGAPADRRERGAAPRTGAPGEGRPSRRPGAGGRPVRPGPRPATRPGGPRGKPPPRGR